MPNFPKNLKDADEKELNDWINQNDPRYATLASEELTRRKFDDFDKSTNFFSKVLGLFAIIQIVVAVMQFILSVQTVYSSTSEKLVMLLMLFSSVGIIIFYFFRLFNK